MSQLLEQARACETEKDTVEEAFMQAQVRVCARYTTQPCCPETGRNALTRCGSDMIILSHSPPFLSLCVCVCITCVYVCVCVQSALVDDFEKQARAVYEKFDAQAMPVLEQIKTLKKPIADLLEVCASCCTHTARPVSYTHLTLPTNREV